MSGLTTPEAVAELRHELRTPLNLIIGYCEMLLEDATDQQQRVALEQTLAAGRDVLERINATVPPTRGEISEADFAALRDALREPQGRILTSTSALLAAGGGEIDPQFERDVRRIRSSAERLLTVELPHGRSGSHAAITIEHPVLGAAEVPPVQPAHILVVDDQEDNRSVLERRLRRQGHTVESATGGRSALELLGSQQFDLVLLDVLMPDLDGLAVLERMKADTATRDIPVIMISALDDVASVVRCIERGAEDHLPKPFDPVLLRARISACLEKKRLRDIELEYLREVGRVIQAAIQVEAGSYENGALAQVAQRGDELGRLARVFDAMANQVRAREDRLKEQVAALRREIGEARQTSSRPAAPRSALNLPTGQLFAGRFEVLDEIGSGGMGMVYRALDRELGDQVAIKTLRPELLQDTSLVERFKSEIRLARSISSKHVVRTHDIGERDGVYYLTMEYVEGITVRELLDTRGRLGPAPTLAIASQLAQSLVAAHEQGVIHRDIKPQNLLLDAAGVLKVMDFGVARLAGGTANLTEVGMLVGTPSYMAPEQMLGESFDHRIDLYATGVVLFECLVGRLPFEAGSAVALIARVLRDAAPAPAALDPEIPQAFSDLVVRLLAKDPAQRPADAAELVRLLSDLS